MASQLTVARLPAHEVPQDFMLVSTAMWYSNEFGMLIAAFVVVVLGALALFLYRFYSRRNANKLADSSDWRAAATESRETLARDTERSESPGAAPLQGKPVSAAPWRSKPDLTRDSVPETEDQASPEVAEHGEALRDVLDDAQFTVYRPRSVVVSQWYDCLAFAHLADNPPGTSPDEPSPMIQVKEQASRLLGAQAEAYRHSTQDARCEIPFDAELRFVPYVDGGEFNPRCRSFRWCEVIHREEFRMRIADSQKVGQTVFGRMSVFLGSLILAEINMQFRVVAVADSVASRTEMTSDTTRKFRKIFPSYSHKDRQIVEQFEQLATMLGDDFLMDCRTLRSGEVWGDRIRALIQQADIFQLFWSWNSIDSEYVLAEWRYAHDLQRQNFIRPMYWEEPLPSRPEKDLPPPELRRLHFQRLPFDAGAVREQPDSLLDQLIESTSRDVPDLRAIIADFRRVFADLPDAAQLADALRIVEHYAHNFPSARHGELSVSKERRNLPKKSLPNSGVLPSSSRSTTTNVYQSKGNARSIQHKLARIRRPRVHIRYESIGGHAIAEKQLPFVIGVMADLSGSVDPAAAIPRDQRATRVAVAERRFVEIDRENFEDCMRTCQPHVAFVVPNKLLGPGKLRVDLKFESLSDFSPDQVADQIPTLRQCVADRKQLVHLQDRLREIQSYGELERYADAIDVARSTVDNTIADLDDRLSQQLSLVLHHPDFQQLEGTWRGLHYLVSNVDTSPSLRIRVLDLSKKELRRLMKKCPADQWYRNPLFAKIFEREFGQAGGIPYGCLVGDYFFDHQSEDVFVLERVAQLAATAHAPFLSGASPSLFGLESWDKMRGKQPSRILESAEYTAWRRLRQSEDARYLTLVAPRFLARAPHNANTTAKGDIRFDEDISTNGWSPYCWANSAFILATVIGRTFLRTGWFAQIRGAGMGGTVEDLPVCLRREENTETSGHSTEFGFTDREAAELSNIGLTTLCEYTHENGGRAAFFTTPTLCRPAENSDPAAAANARLACQLPYVLAACRFVHYVACDVRDKASAFTTCAELQDTVNAWLQQFVLADIASATVEQTACRPLSAARFELTTDIASPGSAGILYVQPHFQLEGLTAPMRMRINLPWIPHDGSRVSEPRSESTSGDTTAGHGIVDHSRAAASRVPEGLIETIEVESGPHTRRVELWHGDLTSMWPDEEVDVLVVSAFPNAYDPTPGSLINALASKGISVRDLAESKEVDLRESFSCWLSTEVAARQADLRFRRILCFEPLVRGAAPAVVGDIFRALAPFAGGAPPIRSVAMPLVAAGYQGYEVPEILVPLVEAAVQWLEVGLPLQTIRIVAHNQRQAFEAQQVFRRLRKKYSGSETPSNEPVEYDVFVSYSHEDRDGARRAADELTKNQLRVFVDELSLQGGQSWQHHIFTALDACQRVMAFYSPAYVNSKVCQEEYNIAWARGRKLSQEILYPIYWCTAELPTYMELVQFVDCRERDHRKLADACAGLVSQLDGK